MRTVLIVEDEPKIREVIASYIRHGGLAALEAETGQEALRLLGSERVDAVVLDLMLPDMDGEAVCRHIRRTSSVPVVMLTAKASQEQRIEGFSLGADDYVTKPFDPRELLARIRAILRRADDSQLLADRIVYEDGALVIDSLRQTVTAHGELINLTPNEYKLLLAMAKHPQRIFAREQLIEMAWGYDYEGDSRTVDQHIKNIRHKIEADPRQPRFIRTVFGAGYRFTGGESP
ncbi:response regulator transcription factor [Paenibacillus aurantiacus]|uniref:Response regulator transcription factor n=1 Tax=Paenibacillus aurantiacus TaxID=1936118 RepID=A0ABV5KLX0_9BACL